MTRHFTAREFNIDLARAAQDGPVTITDHGHPAFVLLSYDDYRRLSGSPERSIAERLASEDDLDIDFQADRHRFGVRPVDLD